MDNLKNPVQIGDWKWRKLLGKGSYGEVALWQNQRTEQQIAIKKCFLIGTSLSAEEIERLKVRWNREIDMMTNRIKNSNIVQAIKAEPSSFIEELNRTNLSGLPLLIMEYCNGGDLRNEITRNCYGLQEIDVLNILKSLRNSISYLHKLDITHRDIKPENIVIQINGDIKEYKLTDLGYAKDIQQNTIASQVGTSGYFAPEIIREPKYSNAVDYWSMGIIIFEVICGVRPFLPHLKFAINFPKILEKKSNHIAIKQNLKKEYIYHENLFNENRINSVLKRYLEDWLKLALDLDVKRRESSPDSKVANRNIFTKIDKILSLNILTIFSLNTHQFLNYEITNEMKMDDLIDLIVHDIKIDRNLIYMILPLEQMNIDQITNDTKPMDLIIENFNDDHTLNLHHPRPMLFITEIHERSIIDENKIQIKISDVIKDNMNTKRFNMESFELLEFCRCTLFFIENEFNLYMTFLKGLNNYAIYLNDFIIKFKNSIDNMTVQMYEIHGSMNLQDIIYDYHKNTLESRNLTQMCGIKIENWEKDHKEIHENFESLKIINSKLSEHYVSILRRSNNTKDQNLIKNCNEKEMKKYFPSDKLHVLYEELKNRHNEKILRIFHKNICDLFIKFIDERKKLLNKQELKLIQHDLLAINIEFRKIQSSVATTLIQLKKFKLRIDESIKQQFNDVLEIIEKHTIDKCEMKQQDELKKINNQPLSLPILNGFRNYGGNSSKIGDNNNINKNSIPTVSLFESLKSLQESSDVRSLIEENQEVRQMTKEFFLEFKKNLKSKKH